MSKGLIAVLVVLGLIFGVGGCGVMYVVGTYNSAVTLGQDVEKKWADVENVYQRRDLIPNLVETTKGYAAHERETFTAVTEARAKVGQINLKAGDLTPENMAMFQAAQGELSGALSRLMVVMEKYPDLKASELFVNLQQELAGTENRITVARRDYNGSAQTYNTAIKRFPVVLFAGMMGFHEKPYFKAEEGADKAPKIDFSRPSGR